MEFGGGHFPGRVAADSHGTASTICEVADQTEAQSVSRFLHQPHELRRLQRRKHVRTTKLLLWKRQSWLWDLTRDLHCCRVSRTPSRKRRRASSPDLQTRPWMPRRPKWSLWKHQSKRWEMPTLRHSKFSRMHWRRPELQPMVLQSVSDSIRVPSTSRGRNDCWRSATRTWQSSRHFVHLWKRS